MSGSLFGPTLPRGGGVAGGGGLEQWAEAEIVYVNKDGSDANDGLTLNKAKLTISAAITAAKALLPTASNPIAVFVYPGVYSERVTLDESYISLIGVGGPSVTIVDHSVLEQSALFIDGASHSDIIGITFAGTDNDAKGMTIDADSGSLCTDLRFVNCIFSSEGSGYINYSSTGIAYLEARFYGCVLTHADYTGTADPISVVIDRATLEFFGCEFYGCGDTNTAECAVTMHSCRLRGGTTGSTHIWNVNAFFTAYDIDAENTNSGRVFYVETVETGALKLFGGRVVTGSGEYADVHAVSLFTTDIVGVSFNKGLSSKVRLSSHTHRVGADGVADKHVNIQSAVDALDGVDGIIELCEDTLWEFEIDLVGPGHLTIDGRGCYTLTRGADANLFRQFSTTAGMLTLKDLEIVDGIIDWDTGKDGSVLELIHCKGGCRIVAANATASTTKIFVKDTKIMVDETDESFIDVQDTNTTIEIRESVIAGNGNGKAIDMNANNGNITIAGSELDGITDPAGATTCVSHHNYYAADPFTGNLSNTLATNYDIT